MGNLMEIEGVFYGNHGDGVRNPMYVDLSKVSAVWFNSGYYRIILGNDKFRITEDSFNKIVVAMNATGDDVASGRLCKLQNDHTWIMQALANILLMCKGDKTSYHPAILLGCYDKELEKMNEAVYEAVLCMQKLIKELEEENKKLKGDAARV